MPLAASLGSRSSFSPADQLALASLSRSPSYELAPRVDMVREGAKSIYVRLLLDGWACQYKVTCEGQRQIVGFYMPGDLCDLSASMLNHMDHSIGAITRVRFAQIDWTDLRAVTEEHPGIALAIWRKELINASIQREWLLNIGQRPAYQRLGHLFVELFFRLRNIGLADRDSCEVPLTQNDLAGATGLTPVHVNRTLQELRRDGLVELDRRRLRLPDLASLIQVSGFSPSYLHLDHEGRQIDAYA